MSADLVVLAQDRPTVGGVFQKLSARMDVRLAVSGPGVGEGPTRVYDQSGRLIVFVSDPVLVMVPGEVERLLGVRLAVPAPVWWVEFRAAADVPEAPQIARQCADELVARHGGTLWAAA